MLSLRQAVKAQVGETISRACASAIGAIVIAGESIRGDVNDRRFGRNQGSRSNRRVSLEVSTIAKVSIPISRARGRSIRAIVTTGESIRGDVNALPV